MVAHRWDLLALDKNTGAVVFRKTAHQGVPRLKRHVKASHASATPATDGRNLVALLGTEGLFCFDMEGELRWRVDLGLLDVGYWGEPEYQWGAASSPLLYENLVIVQNDRHKDSFVAAFDLETGTGSLAGGARREARLEHARDLPERGRGGARYERRELDPRERPPKRRRAMAALTRRPPGHHADAARRRRSHRRDGRQSYRGADHLRDSTGSTGRRAEATYSGRRRGALPTLRLRSPMMESSTSSSTTGSFRPTTWRRASASTGRDSRWERDSRLRRSSRMEGSTFRARTGPSSW